MPTVILSQDTDGDGIPNNIDMDDDNDGIIDAVEFQGIDPTCPFGIYQVVSGQLNIFETSSSSYLPIGPNQPDYNGMGFNPDDGLFYATMSQGGVDSDGDVLARGNIITVEGQTGRINFIHNGSSGSKASGDVYDGKYYSFRKNKLYIYDITGNTFTSINLPNYKAVDFSIIDGVMYGLKIVSGNLTLYKADINASTPTISTLIVSSGISFSSNSFGASFVVNTDQLYFSNNGGGLYELTDYTTSSPSISLIANTVPTNNNDGASCLHASLYPHDFDNDNIPNYEDIDSDNDGILDNTEVQTTTGYIAPSGVDTDGDGLDDAYDVNCNPCGGVTGVTLIPVNKDGLDNFDFLDTDSDNDGESDMIEAYDANDDGVSDITPSGNDADGDGLDDNFDSIDLSSNPTMNPTDNGETPLSFPNDDIGQPSVERDWRDDGDLDGDGIQDINDVDDDNDGIPDTAECPSLMNPALPCNIDSDGDGLPNTEDLDSDNDGIPDLIEAEGIDINGDGIIDTNTDLDGDGLADIYDESDTAGSTSGWVSGTALEHPDSDGDGNSDITDLDSDNDGIPDIVEVGGVDTNGDGLVDNTIDLDGDGLADIYDSDDDGVAGIDAGEEMDPLVETDGSGNYLNGATGVSLDQDGDGLADNKDLDADNDGIPDIIEVGGNSSNNDGKVDVLAAPWDSDGDGLADVYDGNNSGTALVQTTADSNGDGKINASESMTAGGLNNINSDGDPYPNHLDLDADNDGITDVVENGRGVITVDHSSGNLDGMVGDGSIADANQDGWNDSNTTITVDTDGDGIADYLDLDADNDGIVDYLEGVCSACPTFTTPTGADANGNGVLDMYENLTTTNGTGGNNIGTTPNVDDNASNTAPDYLDTDTDNDGSYDWAEGYDLNNNGNASDDLIIMATSYEVATSNGYYINTIDSDLDGIPDWLDNQPSISGHDPNSRPPFLNPTSSYWYDEDHDGLVDLLDASQNGTAAPTPDNNGGNDLDWRDMTALAVLPVELAYFEVSEKDCGAQLKWTTVNEKDFDYFLVEKSSNGYDFERVEVVKSTGNANGDTYIYQDEAATYSNYYRLKMVDLDGSTEYSKVVHVEINCEEMEEFIKTFPNPLMPEQILSLEFTSPKNTEVLVVVDHLGRVVRRLVLETERGKNILRMDISDLSVGSYYVQIIGRKTSQHIIIQQ